MSLFDGKPDREFDRMVAENSFISSVQLVIEEALAARGTSHADLARALEVSEARISQMLSGNGTNLQARTIARIADALRLRACLEFVDLDDDWCMLEPARDGAVRLPDWVSRAVEVIERGGDWSQGVNDNWVHETLPTQRRANGTSARFAVVAA